MMQKLNSTDALRPVSSRDIFDRHFEPTKWFIKGLLQEGATLLSGDPKVGKSYLALQIAIAVSTGAKTVCGSISVGVNGPVLYLSLDDASEKRSSERLHSLHPSGDELEHLKWVHHRGVPKLGQGFEKVLEEEIASGQYALVIIDTLGAILPPSTGSKNMYRSEYLEAVALQEVAQKRGIALLVVHHTNKQKSKSPVSAASGSHGLTGGLDSVMLLQKTKNGASWTSRPRDGEEMEVQLKRVENGGWEVDGGSGTVGIPMKNTPERDAVRAVLKDGPKAKEQIADALGINPDTARKRLQRMASDGELTALDDGTYQLIEIPALVH